MLILFLIALLLCCAGFLLSGRLRPDPGGGAGVSPEKVSIIIPARNEEHNLPALLRSIQGQAHAPMDVVVVDDASTDRTAQVAREHGASVVSAKPLPEGWRGKSWACHQGALAARGDHFLFLDADTRFEPDGLLQVLSRYSQGAFSVGPYHRVRRPYESLSLFFNLCMVWGTAPDRLFGQMLLVSREDYLRVGGYEAVRGQVLENVWLSRHFRALGIPVRSTVGRGALAVRMYPNGLSHLIEGWTKSFLLGAGQTASAVMTLTIGWMTGLMLVPLGACLSGGDWKWGVIYVCGALQVRWLARMIGNYPWYSAILYPLPLVFFFLVFARAALLPATRVRWKGRVVGDS